MLKTVSHGSFVVNFAFSSPLWRIDNQLTRIAKSDLIDYSLPKFCNRKFRSFKSVDRFLDQPDIFIEFI